MFGGFGRSIVAALVIAGCGGTGPSPSVQSGTPSAPNPTPGVTAIATTGPLPTAERLSIAELLASPHPATSWQEVEAALVAAKAADPVSWSPTIDKRAKTCDTGIDPDNPSWTPVEARNAGCQTLVFALYTRYVTSGAQADFDATLTAYNFAILQPIGYPDLAGPQPSDSAAAFKASLDSQLVAANWYGGGS